MTRYTALIVATLVVFLAVMSGPIASVFHHKPDHQGGGCDDESDADRDNGCGNDDRRQPDRERPERGPDDPEDGDEDDGDDDDVEDDDDGDDDDGDDEDEEREGDDDEREFDDIDERDDDDDAREDEEDDEDEEVDDDDAREDDTEEAEDEGDTATVTEDDGNAGSEENEPTEQPDGQESTTEPESPDGGDADSLTDSTSSTETESGPETGTRTASDTDSGAAPGTETVTGDSAEPTESSGPPSDSATPAPPTETASPSSTSTAPGTDAVESAEPDPPQGDEEGDPDSPPDPDSGLPFGGEETTKTPERSPTRTPTVTPTPVPVQIPMGPGYEVRWARFDRRTVRAGEIVTVSATVANTRDRGRLTDLPLKVDGRTVATESVSLPARGAIRVRFEHRFTEPGEHELALGPSRIGTVTVIQTVDRRPTDADQPTGLDGDAGRGQVQVRTAELATDWVLQGYNATLRATVVNPTGRSVRDDLTVTVGGVAVRNETVSLDAGERRIVAIAFPAVDGTVSVDGVAAGRLRVSDRFPGGNVRTLDVSQADGPGLGLGAAVAAVLVLMALLVGRARTRG